MMTLLSITIIIISLTAFFNGSMWNYWRSKSKKLESQLVANQNTLLEAQDNVIVDDIRLKDSRYVIEDKEVKEILVEGVSFINNQAYIQINQVDLDYFDFEDKIDIETHYNYHPGSAYTVKYNSLTKRFESRSADPSYYNIPYITHIFKEEVFKDKTPKYIKLSDTYSSKEEAQLVLQERLDSEFDLKLKELESNYNRELDNLLNK